MPGVELGELGLIGSLAAVVELFLDPHSELLGHPVDVEFRFARREAAHQAEEGRQQLGVLEVGVDRGADPGVLDLHRDRAAVAQPGRVHLADRGGRQRLPVELGEGVLGRAPELVLQHFARQLRRHRRRVVAQPGQRRLVGGLELAPHRRAERDEREHLPRLHQRPFRGTEQLGVALRRADVELGAVGAGQLAPQADDDRLARGASGERRQRDGAPQAPAPDAVFSLPRIH